MDTVLARIAGDLQAMLAEGVSVLVGSRGADFRPSVVRAIGAALDAGGGTVTVYLWHAQAAQVLDDIRVTGHLAVVFSQPNSHRSLQLKARAATLRPADEADRGPIAAYQEATMRMICSIGFPPDMVQALFAHPHAEVTAVRFVPELAYEQTPGPRAGQPV